MNELCSSANAKVASIVSEEEWEVVKTIVKAYDLRISDFGPTCHKPIKMWTGLHRNDQVICHPHFQNLYA